jgi:predicted ester cyclase
MRGEGKEACLQFFGSWLAAFSDARVEVHGIHILGEVAIEEGTFSGTHDGVLRLPTGDISPTGRRVSVDYIQVLRFHEGKHRSFNLIFDRLAMLEQLAIAPAMAG